MLSLFYKDFITLNNLFLSPIEKTTFTEVILNPYSTPR